MPSKAVSARLRQLRKELKLTQQAMSETLGIGKAALSMIETGRASLTDRNKQTLARVYGANPEWLDRGLGPMFFESRDLTEGPLEEPLPGPASVPLYELSPGETLSALFADESREASQTLRLPGLAACDGALHVPGDSMYPLLSAGDVVFYRRVRDIASAVFWGEMYLLSFGVGGDEYLTLRYLHRSERPGFVRIASENPRYPEQELELTLIRALALVRGSLRYHTT